MFPTTSTAPSTDADVVYHLAAMVDRPGKREDFLEANLEGTKRVLAACLEQGVGRVVYASSLAVYGPVQNHERIDEDTPLDASPQLRDFYAESKILADRFAVKFAQETTLPLTDHQAGHRLWSRTAGFLWGFWDLPWGRAIRVRQSPAPHSPELHGESDRRATKGCAIRRSATSAIQHRRRR